jgi:hypothetical protein
MESRLTRRMASKWYCDIIIAPRGLFLIETKRDAGHQLNRQQFTHDAYDLERHLHIPPASDLLVGDMEVNDGPPRVHMVPADVFDAGSVLPESVKVQIDPDIYSQSTLDWQFIMDEIHAAVDRGRPLDEQVIRGIAKKRCVYASDNYRYPDRPGSGPTVESSEEIVKSVVDLYQLATEPSLTAGDAATDGS